MQTYGYFLSSVNNILKYGLLVFIRFDSKFKASDSLSVRIISISVICLTIRLNLGDNSLKLEK